MVFNMRTGFQFTVLFILVITVFPSGFGQQNTVMPDSPGLRSDTILNSIIQEPKVSVQMTKEQALRYLQGIYDAGYWNDYMDPLRQSLGQLIFISTHERFDSLRTYLFSYPYDSLNIPFGNFLVSDSIHIQVPHILPLKYIPPSDTVMVSDSEGVIIKGDSLQAEVYNIPQETLRAYQQEHAEQTVILKDSVFFAVVDTLDQYYPMVENLPFLMFRSTSMGDSIEAAVRALSDYVEKRDSSVIYFSGVSSQIIPVWLNSMSERMVRYWLRNEYNDSVAVWIGSVGRNKLGIFLEEGISFRRPVKQTTISDAQLTLKQINSGKLQELNKIYVKPQYWKFRSEASFVLNQASLTNWVKGGESSISTSLDITGYADYDNKKLKLVSNNYARLKYGLVASGDKGIRKNLDLLETNSKVNHKAFGKFDFSAIMLFKTQVAKGRDFQKTKDGDTSILVSKMMNPATLTIGFGLDYKPNKTTSINFSPLSYKGTFVTDTVGVVGINAIDPTKYGIPKGKLSKHEPGASLQVSYEFNPIKAINIKNRLHLFTNYINKPQNIDIDWELIATAKINWFTEVRLNTQLIYDDDTKIPVVDKEGQPVLDANGQQKKSSRIQFKELLGFSFVFRF